MADVCAGCNPLHVLFARACAVRERTADGVSVGRCWHRVVDGRCERHGDVRAVQERYTRTGQLTDERDFRVAVGK